jgi:hypothetical protein
MRFKKLCSRSAFVSLSIRIQTQTQAVPSTLFSYLCAILSIFYLKENGAHQQHLVTGVDL